MCTKKLPLCTRYSAETFLLAVTLPVDNALGFEVLGGGARSAAQQAAGLDDHKLGMQPWMSDGALQLQSKKLGCGIIVS